ncbi:EamA family transporter RarD [Aminipila butyrica]|uniref:EamA family transporter RarD n=1 Tax=Aminipila butyrica TaxID=433296 RepID=A0A858BWX5_9FIRM|nr:EamA family transporter RarD [Aminipila butyrica]QIB69595.1 EamA family transporter RarD [Aminipila butyrica]
MDIQDEKKKYKIGMSCALGCAILWGFLPIYWKALKPIDSMVIIYYRIFFVGLTTFLAAYKMYGREKLLAPLKNKKMLPMLILAGILISANWSIYIWAVNANYVIQTCIGYYIEPLMVCVFGMVLFKEKVDRYKLIALCFALAGVAVILLHFKEMPAIALSLALTFATYAAIKKRYQMEALIALFYETIFLTPLAFVLIIYAEMNNKGAFSVAEPYQLGMLAFVGIVTAMPLALFAMAANRISMVSLGITEYLSPSISLVIGIFLFQEPFDQIQFSAFAIIWIGLAFFTYGEIKESKHGRES